MGVSLRLLELLDAMPAHVSSRNEETTGVVGDNESSGLAKAVAMATVNESAPLEPWLAVLPQLLARLNHPSNQVADLVHTLLTRLAVAAPKALVLQVVVGVFETRPHDAKAASEEGASQENKTGTFSTLHGRYLTLRAALASGHVEKQGIGKEELNQEGHGILNDNETASDDRALLVAEHEV
jgi:hypothetical protein